MNTINNPLILKWSHEYKVNKPGDQSGEYVSKELAVEMLNFLESIITDGWDIDPQLKCRCEELILKAKG